MTEWQYNKVVKSVQASSKTTPASESPEELLERMQVLREERLEKAQELRQASMMRHEQAMRKTMKKNRTKKRQGEAGVLGGPRFHLRCHWVFRPILHVLMMLSFLGLAMLILVYGMKSDMAVLDTSKCHMDVLCVNNTCVNATCINHTWCEAWDFYDNGTAMGGMLNASVNATKNYTVLAIGSGSNWMIGSLISMPMEILVVQPLTIMLRVLLVILLGPRLSYILALIGESGMGKIFTRD